MDEIREKYYGGDNAAREAFEELCAMVDNINVSTYNNLYSISEKKNKNGYLFLKKTNKWSNSDSNF